jgi:hypothetical protein
MSNTDDRHTYAQRELVQFQALSPEKKAFFLRHYRNKAHDPRVRADVDASVFWMTVAGVVSLALLVWLRVEDVAMDAQAERAAIADQVLATAEKRGLVSGRECADSAVRVLTFGDC